MENKHLIRTYRALAGLSQQDVALMAGCTQAYISLIERGEVTASPELLAKICDTLNIPEGADGSQ